MLSIQWKVPERERPKGGSDAENACEASGTHALRVQVGGGAPTPRVLSCFSKAGKMFPIGNDRAARPSVKPRSGALNRGLQNLETPLHA